MKLSSPGPVFFRQERMGRRRDPISPLQVPEHANRASGGPAVTVADDSGSPRSCAGSRARSSTSSQLLNVLRGDMSLVGPRPEVRRYVERFSVDYERSFPYGRE